MDEIQFRQLLERYRSGSIDDTQRAQLESWLSLGRFDGPELSDAEMDRRLLVLSRRLPLTAPSRFLLWKRVAAAAAIVLAIGAGVLWLKDVNVPTAGPAAAYADDVAPGGNRAVLTLGNGRRVRLDSAAVDREVARERGTRISATGGKLAYLALGEGETASVMNALETPRGGTYQLVLSDGTRVWLNAQSKLSYPSSFSGAPERRVSLSGEGYFEVARDASHPFVVEGGGQSVRVLGTHFNVDAYAGQAVRTTLLEGAVAVSAGGGSGLLRPGQQAVSGMGTSGLRVLGVEADKVVAWKEGYFLFDSEQLGSIMERLSRWYDVQVVFLDPSLRSQTFFGMVDRSVPLSRVLGLLERTGTVSFAIQGRTVTVSGR